MSRVQPFRGVRFSAQAGEMKDLMAPPYDVISDSYREQLYQRSPQNIVRISKSAEIRDEVESEHYTQAAATWRQWRAQGLTIRDEHPSFYLYEQEFQIQQQTYQRLGLVCAHQLVDFGQGVLPHEETLSGPKADRLRLLEKTQTHFGQIFGLYADEEGRIDQTLRRAWQGAEELYSAQDDDGVWHRVRRLSERAQVQEISQLFADREMIIADGHHRYETALKYARAQGTTESSYLMMTAVSAANPGLLILPTHRLLKDLPDFALEPLLEKLQPHFEVHRLVCDAMNFDEKKRELLAAMKSHFEAGRNAFGLYTGVEEFVLLVKKGDALVGGTGSEVYKVLDVVVLHQMILEDQLGIDAEKLAQQSHVEYIKDSGAAIDESIAKVRTGSHQAVFLMNPPTMEQTAAVAHNGEKMPQKSTFFHPKVFTGLVTYQMEAGVIEPRRTEENE